MSWLNSHFPKDSRITGARPGPKRSGATETREFRVYRRNPDDGKNPSVDTLSRRHPTTAGTMVPGRPDLRSRPHRIRPLSFRRSCREGRVRLSAAMNIDGQNHRLACTSRCTTWPTGRRRSRSIAAAPGPWSKADLVPDLTNFLRGVRLDRALAEDGDATPQEGMGSRSHEDREGEARRPL